jgi:hypothetical protein
MYARYIQNSSTEGLKVIILQLGFSGLLVSGTSMMAKVASGAQMEAEMQSRGAAVGGRCWPLPQGDLEKLEDFLSLGDRCLLPTGEEGPEPITPLLGALQLMMSLKCN